MTALAGPTGEGDGQVGIGACARSSCGRDASAGNAPLRIVCVVFRRCCSPTIGLPFTAAINEPSTRKPDTECAAYDRTQDCGQQPIGEQDRKRDQSAHECSQQQQ